MPLDDVATMDIPEFSVSTSRDGRRIVVTVAGEIDIASVLAVQHQLERAEADGAEPLVLDLEDVTFMDSTGVAMILDAQRRALAEGRRFALRRVAAQPYRVLQIVGVAETLLIEV